MTRESSSSKRRKVPLSARFRILKRDAFTCVYCGRKPPVVVLQVDHARSVAAGGDNEPENLVTSCSECNNGKSADCVATHSLRVVAPTRAVRTIEPHAHPAVGLFFHTHKDGRLQWQGYVESVSGGRVVVTLFSWMDGRPNGKQVLPEEWLLIDSHTFYGTCEEMNEGWEKTLEPWRQDMVRKWREAGL